MSFPRKLCAPEVINKPTLTSQQKRSNLALKLHLTVKYADVRMNKSKDLKMVLSFLFNKYPRLHVEYKLTII